jgi:hypothetical protein
MFAKARLAELAIPELEQSRAAVLNTLASANRIGATSTPSNGISGFSPLRK